MLFSNADSMRDELRAAEAELLRLARHFGNQQPSDYDMQLLDTVIPRSAVPLKPNKHEGDKLTIHAIHLTSNNKSQSTPLVLQHGYMNGGVYFYRNLVGLTKLFQNIYSIDMLGWGLSSRPAFSLTDDSVETAQDFFVESLEAWRKEHNIERMILAGHSMGGYLSVAYCEKYPERVERLVLLSPVGVPEESEVIRKRRKSYSRTRRFMFALSQKLFDMGSTPCSIVRTLPAFKARQYMMSYVKNRLPSIKNPQEQSGLAEYLYLNCVMPGSGEYCLNRILTVHAFAKKPLVYRIPLLKISHVSFLYGSMDWMDCSGGLDTHRLCEELRSEGKTASNVSVHTISNAGHLLMLDNWNEFNAAVAIAAGGQHLLGEADRLPTDLTARVKDDRLTAESSEQIIQPPPQVVYN